MKEKLMAEVMQQMLPYLDNAQLKQLKQVMEHTLFRYEVSDVKTKPGMDDSKDLIARFIAAKRIEGCSEKTLKYYQTTINAMTSALGKNVRQIQTEDLRTYLTEYQSRNQSSRVTIDNIRRILSSFFSWLEDEDYIIKSPVRRIHKVKTVSSIKETYSDEDLEKMRDNCDELRDLAMIDMLASTGMRVGDDFVIIGLNPLETAKYKGFRKIWSYEILQRSKHKTSERRKNLIRYHRTVWHIISDLPPELPCQSYFYTLN